MAYTIESAPRGAHPPARTSARRGPRGIRFGVGFAIVGGGLLMAGAVLMTAAHVTSTSLTARSVLGTATPVTVAAAIRMDAYRHLSDAHRQLAERSERSRLLVEIADAAASEPQLADAGPGAAGSCGLSLTDRTVAFVDDPARAGAPAPTVGDFVATASGDFAGPPCLTDGDLKTASLSPAAGFSAAPRPAPAPVLAMAVSVTPDEREPAPVREYTGSIAPTASLPPAAGQRPRREDFSGYPASLAALDGRTAVYDIVAHTVYLPDGTRLEAHSGLGAKRDDPRHVHVRMHGATPPNVYDLKLREALFHGVRAIRLTPIERGKMFGRDGILAHTYMLGPNGQSNGCVSFRNYPAFLQAFLKGEVKRMVVVARLPAPPSRAMLRGVRGDQIALNGE
jgi:hypothetical protein